MVDPAAALSEVPEMFTYHVPDARPDSVNVTVYLTGMNFMAVAGVGPLTVTDAV